MKVYEGTRTDDGCVVTANGRPLNLRLDIRAHSPTGAEWGYGGSGPAQTALALLADALGDDDKAQDLYQKFKREVVADFEKPGFIITQAEIRCWVADVLSKREGTSEEPLGE